MESVPIEWYDRYSDAKERKIYTYEEHEIPGLRMIGYAHTSHATAPLEMHYHKDCFEFTYMVQGNLNFHVADKSYCLSGGDTFFTFPDEPHDTGEVAMSLHKMYWFQLEIQNPDGFLYMNHQTACVIISQLKQLSDRVIKMTGAEPLMRQIVCCIESGGALGRIQAGNLLGVFLCGVLKNSNLSGGRSVQITADILQTTNYIREHIREEISMEQLASMAILSVSRFKQKFKEQIGSSPRNYINFQKIELAKKLLEKKASVTEVAMALGFSSSDYFSVVFRRYTSTTPTKYAQQIADHK